MEDLYVKVRGILKKDLPRRSRRESFLRKEIRDREGGSLQNRLAK